MMSLLLFLFIFSINGQQTKQIRSLKDSCLDYISEHKYNTNIFDCYPDNKAIPSGLQVKLLKHSFRVHTRFSHAVIGQILPENIVPAALVICQNSNSYDISAMQLLKKLLSRTLIDSKERAFMQFIWDAVTTKATHCNRAILIESSNGDNTWIKKVICLERLFMNAINAGASTEIIKNFFNKWCFSAICG